MNKDVLYSEEKFRQNVWFQSVTKASVLAKIKQWSHILFLSPVYVSGDEQRRTFIRLVLQAEKCALDVISCFSRRNNNQIIVNRMPPVNTR